jgi:hypothetical protein
VAASFTSNLAISLAGIFETLLGGRGKAVIGSNPDIARRPSLLVYEFTA